MKLYKVEDYLITFFQAAIVATILGIVAMVGVNAWIIEDDARIAKLKQHVYDVAYARAEGPKAPTGVRPNYGDLSEPKVRHFQDASRKATTGMGYDARRAERGR